MSKSSKPVTAAEFMRQLESDLEWVRERDEREARHRELVQRFAENVAPLMADLNAAGFRIESIDDLEISSDNRHVAFPILADHLRRGYDNDILECIIDALAVPAARRVVGDYLLAKFDCESNANLQFAIAKALSQMYTFDEVSHVNGIGEFKGLFDRSVGKDKMATAERGTSQVVHELAESSMSFDMGNVRPFLKRVASFIESGFDDAKIDQIVAFVESLSHNDEAEMQLEIVHGGSPTPLIIRVFVDDIDAPDIYCFTASALARSIDAEYDAFCEELGI
jgi:hypothetical protein